MAKDREFSTNDEVNRSPEFQERITAKEKVTDTIKELLITSTKEVFEEKGYKFSEGSAGEYADKSTYGKGAHENKFNVKIAGKTKSSFQKETIVGTKTMISVINIVFTDDFVTIEYKTPESGFFRGVDANGNTFMVNDRFNLSYKDITTFSKELKEKFNFYADKEFNGMISTKIGVDDKIQKSTTSVVENAPKRSMTLAELFSEDVEMNSDKIKGLNTVPLTQTTPEIQSDKKLFFDEDSISEGGEEENKVEQEALLDAAKQLQSLSNDQIEPISLGAIDPENGPCIIVRYLGKNYKMFFDNEHGSGDFLFIQDFPYDNGSSKGFRKGMHGELEFIAHIATTGTHPRITTQNDTTIDYSMNEITSTGPAISNSDGGHKDGANSGSGGYKPKDSWKKTPYAKNKQKRPSVTHDYKVVPQNESEDETDEKSEDKPAKNTSEKKSSESSNKSNGVAEPKSTKNFDPNNGNGSYKNTNQTSAPKSDNDDFWQEVKLIPGSGYVPVGMDQNFVAGMHDASKGDMSKRGYSEGKNNNTQIISEEKYRIGIRQNSKTTVMPIIAQSLKEALGKIIHQGVSVNDIFEIHDNMMNLVWSETSGRNLSDLTQGQINENVKKPDLTQKKFFNLSENAEKGINKRYLITEKTSDEYEKERWKKLTSFKTRETIKEAEEMNEFFDLLAEQKDITPSIFNKKALNENLTHDDIFNDNSKENINESSTEETIQVEKPGSKFGIEYKFFKKDFLNESKAYILDLNSRVYVKNPNSK